MEMTSTWVTAGGVPAKSVDNGTTWQLVGNGLKKMSVFSFLATPGGIFVGYERGVARTTDHGASWQRTVRGLTNTSVTSRFADGNTALYASVRSSNMGSSDGVFVTTDGGQNWASIDSGLWPSPTVTTLVKAGSNLIIGDLGLYIKTPADAAFRRPVGISETVIVNALMSNGQYVFAGTSGGGEIYRSTDYGLTWSQANTGLGTQQDQVYSFCEKSGIIFAGAFDALYKSVDLGATWVLSNAGIQSGATITGMTVLGNDLFAVSRSNRRIYKSSDNGASWVSVNNGLPAIINFNTIASGNGSLFAGSDLGVYRSDNGGASWILFNDGLFPRNEALSMAVFNGKLFLGTDETSVWGFGLGIIPIILENFTARENNGDVYLQWRTSEETNGKKFVVERSSDGRNFISLANLNASGNANGHDYGFVDRAPQRGLNYYRLALVDRDGDKKYSAMHLINLQGLSRLSVAVTPNPAHELALISMTGNLKGRASVSAYDLAGKKRMDIYAGEINSCAFSTAVDISALPKGLYIIHLAINQEVATAKLIKQ